MGIVQSTKASCPSHPDEKIKYLCDEKKCIEPLCEKCIKDHRKIHEEVGFAPTFIPIMDIISKYQKQKKKEKQNKKKQFKEHITVKDNEFVPTGYVLKTLTKQYFDKRFKECYLESIRSPSSKIKQQKSEEEFRFKSRLVQKYHQEKQSKLRNKSKSKLSRNSSKNSSSSSSSSSSDQQKKDRKVNKQLAQTVMQYEIYKKLKNNAHAKEKLKSFLRQNLILNQGLVGKDFKHLYS